jgi:hypothetical protein
MIQAKKKNPFTGTIGQGSRQLKNPKLSLFFFWLCDAEWEDVGVALTR